MRLAEDLLLDWKFDHKDILLSYVSYDDIIRAGDGDTLLETVPSVDMFIEDLIGWLDKGHRIEIYNSVTMSDNKMVFIYRLFDVSQAWRLRMLQEALDV